MITSLTLVCLLSVDSLIGSMISATLGMSRSAARTMIILFAVCDGVATAAGHFLAPFWVSAGVLERVQAVVLLLYAALVIRLLVYMKGAAPSKLSNKLLYVLPIVFSLDNLASGLGMAGKGESIWPWVAMMGATSGLMSLLGFRIGSAIRDRLSSRGLAAMCVGLLGFVALTAR